MGTGQFRLAAIWLAMLLALGFAAPAAAATAKPSCHAFSTAEATPAEMAADRNAWICRAVEWKDPRPVSWLRFDAQGWRETGTPRSFVTGITKFDELSLIVVNADGTDTRADYAPGEATPVPGGSVFSVPLPPVSDDARAILVRIVEPWNATILSSASISTEPGGESWDAAKLSLVAILVGLLIAPVIFDFALFFVLRQRFVLWHAAIAVAMLGYVASFSGLISLYADFTVIDLSRMLGVSIVLAASLAGFFTADFLEPGMLSLRMRNALRVTSAILLLGPGIIALHPPFLDHRADSYFFYGFLPAITAQAVAMVQALRRGSRAVKFQIAAWTPILLWGLERILRGVGLYAAPPLIDELLYFVLVFEVVASATGVADRLMALRRQRDNARTEARMLERLAEHDPLTGLLNRRAIEPNFQELCTQGFSTFALIDLDHFKAINDEHGHDVGDQVLRAVAEGLAPDEDTLVVRLGGEEFLMLLRGKDGRNRAEQRRQALPRHIASRVTGLDRLVTASMGLVEGPPEAMAASTFRQAYSSADKLLYEAKQAGRNRTISEKLTLFAPRRGERRKSDRRKTARVA